MGLQLFCMLYITKLLCDSLMADELLCNSLVADDLMYNQGSFLVLMLDVVQ